MECPNSFDPYDEFSQYDDPQDSESGPSQDEDQSQEDLDSTSLTSNSLESRLRAFGVISEETGFAEVSRALYASYLNKLSIGFEENIHTRLIEYSECIFNFVDFLHSLTPEEIRPYLVFLDQNEFAYVADLIFICWCLPLPTESFSQVKYDRDYASNIRRYLPILTDLMDCYVLTNFCLESLTNGKSCPIHCIDLVWHFLVGSELEFRFVNRFSKRFITISPQKETESFQLSINIEYALSIGLGDLLIDLEELMQKSDQSNREKLPSVFPTVSFKTFTKAFVTSQDLIDTILECDDTSSKNFREQFALIRKSPDKYYGDSLVINTTMH